MHFIGADGCAEVFYSLWEQLIAVWDFEENGLEEAGEESSTIKSLLPPAISPNRSSIKSCSAASHVFEKKVASIEVIFLNQSN